MREPYYRLPLRLDQVIAKEHPAMCGLKHSVAQHLHLIISTYQGESAFSHEYGCSLWDEEFNIQFNLRWKDQVCESLKSAVSRFERRLDPEEINAYLEEKNERSGGIVVHLRRRLHIEIKGVLRQTNEPFHFRDTIFISPVAQR